MKQSNSKMGLLTVSFFIGCLIFILLLCFSFNSYQKLLIISKFEFFKNEFEVKELNLDHADFNNKYQEDNYFSKLLENGNIPISTILLFDEKEKIKSDYEYLLLDKNRKVYINVDNILAYIIPKVEPTFYILSYCLSNTILLISIVNFFITISLGLILLVFSLKYNNINQTPSNNGYPKWFILLGFASVFSVFLSIIVIIIALSNSMEDYHINFEKYEQKSVKFDSLNLHFVYDKYDTDNRAVHKKTYESESGICYSKALNNLQTPIYVSKVKNLNESAKHLIWYSKDINKAYLAIDGEKLEPTYKAFIHELMKFWWLFLSIPSLYIIIKKHKTIN